MSDYDNRVKHGLAKKHPLYGRWVGMRQRCNDKNHIAYQRYGGAGITVCDEWSNFQQFIDDMGEYQQGQSIERRDNTKGYSKENCYWATASEQSKNRRMTVWIEFDGRTQCLSDWAKEIGISMATLQERLTKWGKEKSLTTPKLTNGTWQTKEA
jgi:hypothetical protein